jgi:RNA polymerase sigma-70 factor (ECF subfamily)
MEPGTANGGWVHAAVVDEAELAVRFAAGEPDSVGAVYRAYGRLVYAVAYRVLGDATLAEDATQQAFVPAWQNAASFDPSRSLGPWLATIARRAAIDTYRRNRRHRESRNVDDIDLNDPSLTSLPPSAEGIYDAWQVRRALDTLPDHDRELIRLQHYRQLTHLEIAEHLAIPVGTVKSRSFRAHRRLAGLLGHLRVDSDAETDVPTESRARPPDTGGATLDLTKGGVRHD